MITIDLRMDGAYIKENMVIKWTAESGFVENIHKLVKEYKVARNLNVSKKRKFELLHLLGEIKFSFLWR
jgi:hypothetical protein